jgi:hypothetical protein
MYSSDPNIDFLEHDREAERWLESRPVCSICGNHIQEEYALYLDDWICPDCVKENTKYVERG